MISIFGKKVRLFRPRTIWIRKVVQAFFFILIAFISINHTLSESGKGIDFLSNASLHALCPFGGVVTIYQYTATGAFVQKIHESSFVLMVIGFFLAILFGPVFCGWVCPLVASRNSLVPSVKSCSNAISTKLFHKRWTKYCASRAISSWPG